MRDIETMPFTREGLEMLHTWVHESLDIMAGHFDRMPVDLLTQQVDGFGTAPLLKQVLHVVQVEWDWMSRVRGRPPRTWSAKDFPTLLSVVAGKREVVELTRADLAALSAEALHEVPTHVGEDWPGPPRAPAFIVLHLMTHHCHHKGQMAAMCRLLGHPAPDTDLQRA